MRQGKVIKAAGGFFTVRDQAGSEYLCRARGALKKGKRALIVGDEVIFESLKEATGDSSGEGVVEKVLPRANFLPRPPVANVDQVIVVMSLKKPDCDWQMISRIAVMAEKEGLPVLVCLNKTDLIPPAETDKLNELIDPFPYPVIYTSALSGAGTAELKSRLAGCCSALAGPSGVGKSTLLNFIQPGLSLQTGAVSEKIGRGKHTTRQAALLPLDNGGSVVDTPGFTRLDFQNLEPESLAACFPELEALRGRCGFRDCLHLEEPNCAVSEELGRTLNPIRYEHYKYFMQELSR